jgi:NitT/TauT family transport system permease protein/taurine transport system permease protein
MRILVVTDGADGGPERTLGPHAASARTLSQVDADSAGYQQLLRIHRPGTLLRPGVALMRATLRTSMRTSLSSALWFFAPFAVLLVLWAVLVPYFDVNPRLFPHLGSVAQAGWDGIQDGTLIRHIGASLLRVTVGTALALVFAIPLGIAMGVSPAVSSFLTPPFRFFSVLAGIAWIPVASLWFGYGFGAITFVIFNAVFFIVTYNTLLGVSTIPRQVRNAAASLGAGRWAMLTEVLLPGALPNIVTGIRTGLGFAWRGLIAAEMIATNVGLGYMLFVARDFYKTEVIVLGMIVIGVLWLLLDRLLLAPIERATSERWGLVQRA